MADFVSQFAAMGFDIYQEFGADPEDKTAVWEHLGIPDDETHTGLCGIPLAGLSKLHPAKAVTRFSQPAGAGVFVCEECVDIAVEIMHENHT